MSNYIDIPIISDPDALAQEAFDYVVGKIPDWIPNDGNLETILIEAIARITAEARDVASAVPTDIYRNFGSLVGILAHEATFATTTTTWTAINNAGYTIPAGTQVGIRTSGDIVIPFETLNDAVIPNGSTTVTAVPIQALEAGAEASGLPLASTVELLDTLDYITTVALLADTSGGTDAEDDDVYLNRLVARLQLLSPRPILPQDFATLATDIDGVARAVAVDGYDPDHNLLTANQSSLETDTAGWAVDANSTIARDTAQHSDGTASLRVRSVAGGDASAKTTVVTQIAAVQGQRFTATAEFRSAVSARSCQVELWWYTGLSAFISATVGATVADTTTGFTSAFVTGLAPATAAFVIVVVKIKSTGAANEDHYVDKIALRHGTSLTWKVGGTPELNNERMVTVVSVDADGEAVSAPVRQAVDDYLEGLREVTFVVNEADPAYTVIDVTFAAKAKPGYDPATTEIAAEQAVANYLSPKNWGLPDATTDTDAVAPHWQNVTTIRYLELAQVINEVGGIDYITSLTFRRGTESFATTDIVLDGVVPMPRAGVIAGTVT